MFQSEIETYVHKTGSAEQYQLHLPSPFTVLYIREKKFLLHLVGIEPQLLQKLPADFFTLHTDAAAQAGLQMVHIWEDRWIQRKNIVLSRITALLGNSKRIHGRSTAVLRTDKKTSEAFLDENHLQGYTNAYYKYALLYKDKIVALALFSKSRVMHDGIVPYRSYELVRYASLNGYTITGGLSKLLQAFIAEVNPAHLMTYADRDWGAGESYRKLGFVFSGNSAPLCFYLHPKEMVRWYPHRLPPGFETEKQVLKAGYLRIHNAGNSKFILDRRLK